MTETILERQCIKLATLVGFTSAKLTVHRDVGFPGRIFFIPGGRPLLVLFNQTDDDNALKEKQQQHLKTLEDNGYNAMFCESFKGFLNALAIVLSDPASLQSP
jgi:hypothetical protein